MRRIFISSVQKELAAERAALRDFIQGDLLLSRFFEVFLFEDQPAADRNAADVYLEQVGLCPIYLGVLGDEYGFVDAKGKSPTEREFDLATKLHKTRLIFVKGQSDKIRHPKMLALVQKAGKQLIRRRFGGVAELNAAVYASLLDYLEHEGLVRTAPFDAAACGKTTVRDLDPTKIKRFLEQAKEKRSYPLPTHATPAAVIGHLNLRAGSHLSHAAILLFGKEPQKHLLSSQVKCMHFPGTEAQKPMLAYQIFKGSVFELAEQCNQFLPATLSRLVREHWI